MGFDNLFPYRVKITQVAAGFRASFFLSELRSILVCGTIGELKNENSVQKFNLKIKVKFSLIFIKRLQKFLMKIVIQL